MIEFMFQKETDINKTSNSRECTLSHYWHFKDINFKFQLYLYNGCHAVSVMAHELRSIAILNAKSVDHMFILWYISRDEAANILINSAL